MDIRNKLKEQRIKLRIKKEEYARTSNKIHIPMDLELLENDINRLEFNCKLWYEAVQLLKSENVVLEVKEYAGTMSL